MIAIQNLSKANKTGSQFLLMGLCNAFRSVFLIYMNIVTALVVSISGQVVSQPFSPRATSYNATVQGPYIRRNVIVSGYATFYQIQFFVHILFFN